jgi:hypothetical protein
MSAGNAQSLVRAGRAIEIPHEEARVGSHTRFCQEQTNTSRSSVGVASAGEMFVSAVDLSLRLFKVGS